MRILVAGQSGQLAHCLAERAAAHGVDLTCLGRPQLDLLDRQSLERAMLNIRPDIVINTAAYTGVDLAESETDLAFAANAKGAGQLAEVAGGHDCPIVHISTDYVFSGEGQNAYLETDPTAPRTVYGKSKLAGETAVSAANARHLILRTAWIYSSYGSNFLTKMLARAGSGEAVRVVDDQAGNPTSGLHLADIVLELCRMVLEPKVKSAWGVYHVVAAGETSWAGFAEAVFTASAEQGGPSVPVERVSSTEFAAKAPRPANSRLNCDKLEMTWGLRLPDWQQGVTDCVRRILDDRGA